MPDHNVEIWNQLANTMMDHDLHKEAVYYFDKLLAVDAINDKAVEGKANALDMLGKVEEALDCLSGYLESNSSAIYLWILKGDLLDAHYKDLRGGIDCYNRALELNPRNEEAWVKKAYALKHMGKYADAAACFETALQLFNENFDLRNLEYYQVLSEEYNVCCNLRGD